MQLWYLYMSVHRTVSDICGTCMCVCTELSVTASITEAS